MHASMVNHGGKMTLGWLAHHSNSERIPDSMSLSIGADSGRVAVFMTWAEVDHLHAYLGELLAEHPNAVKRALELEFEADQAL